MFHLQSFGNKIEVFLGTKCFFSEKLRVYGNVLCSPLAMGRMVHRLGRGFIIVYLRTCTGMRIMCVYVCVFV